jgi:prevent-host-death family protein
MVSVDVKELKVKLSSFIAQAREGEEIVITDHGKDVALMVPLSRERRAVKILQDQGKAKWARGKPKGASGVRSGGKALSETVMEDRR